MDFKTLQLGTKNPKHETNISFKKKRTLMKNQLLD